MGTLYESTVSKHRECLVTVLVAGLSENLLNPKSTESVKHLYIYIHLIALEEILLQDI